jgi:hypothetical protein
MIASASGKSIEGRDVGRDGLRGKFVFPSEWVFSAFLHIRVVLKSKKQRESKLNPNQ